MVDEEADDVTAQTTAVEPVEKQAIVKLFNRNKFQVAIRLKSGLDACLAPSGWSGKMFESNLPDQLPLGVHKKREN